jgi:hypothetical protein
MCQTLSRSSIASTSSWLALVLSLRSITQYLTHQVVLHPNVPYVAILLCLMPGDSCACQRESADPQWLFRLPD